MMTNPLISYYTQQAQTGGALHVYRGPRHQQSGAGFGSIIRGLLPLLKKTGTNLLASGIAGVASDIASGSKVKEALKQRGIAAAKQLASDTCDKIKQKGEGLFKNSGMVRAVKRKKNRSLSTKSLIETLVNQTPKRRVVRRKKTKSKKKPKKRSAKKK